MPTYTFKDTNTNEIFDKFMAIKDYDKFCEDNKHLERLILSAPGLGDSIRMGLKGMDGGFREVLHKIAENNPKSNLKNKLSRN